MQVALRAVVMTDHYRSPGDIPGPEESLAGTEFQSGLRDAFVTEHLRRVFLQIYRMVGSIHDAQDLTQEAFIKALQRQDQLKDEKKAAHWLSRIATNTAIDFLRRNGKVNFSDIDDLAEPIASPSHESPEQILLRAERR